jgi:uncharacterized membrane protein YbhN (UPF0104 family)
VFAWPTFGLMLIGVALVALFAAALWQSRRFDVRAGLFPWTITAVALALAVVHLVTERAGRRRSASARRDETDAPDTPGETRRAVAICAWILGMYAAIWLLGFSLATLLTTLLYLKTSRERWPLSVALSLAGSAFVFGLFERGLGVPFPPGRILVWLGVVA